MQLEFFDVPSPCIGICQSNDKGQCLGCFRTREERQSWHSLSNDEKQKMIKRCRQRQKRKENKAKVKVVTEEITSRQQSLLDPTQPPTANSNNDLDFSDFEL